MGAGNADSSINAGMRMSNDYDEKKCMKTSSENWG
jgi:hypothetical protein